eukprot:10365809-Lingulodinium_polyedra.AAC.1
MPPSAENSLVSATAPGRGGSCAASSPASQGRPRGPGFRCRCAARGSGLQGPPGGPDRLGAGAAPAPGG